METQSVVVIQDASSEACWEAIRWVLHGLSLKTGDMVTLISVLTRPHNTSSRSYMGTKKSGKNSSVTTNSFAFNLFFLDFCSFFPLFNKYSNYDASLPGNIFF